jgi:cytochrome b6-f complex iron-sulfur subunit
MDRRRFLKTTAAGGAILSVGVMPQGCGNPVSPAPLAKVKTIGNAADVPLSIREAILLDLSDQSDPGYGTVQLLAEFYPQLATVGGAITLELDRAITATDTRGYSVPLDNTILVVHQDVGTFLAVQSSCPHAACPLGYNAAKQLIECPCHASRFFATDKIGAVEHPPANQALERWKLTATMPNAQTTILTIDLKETILFDCASLPAVDATKKLTLPFADFPQLQTVGGVVCGQPTGLSNPIIVTRLDASTVIAVDSKCTHLGCTVGWNQGNQDFECPCHGSTFAIDGRVKVGPATTPLKSYAVTVNADSVVVTIT